MCGKLKKYRPKKTEDDRRRKQKMHNNTNKFANNRKGVYSKTMNDIVLINEETVQSKIFVIRGQKVMLDSDLAEIYGYETKNLNRQVKNNQHKFEGDDFMFQLTDEEVTQISRCKNFTLNKGNGRGGNIKYNPYAFTEQGVYMLMTVLRGELATKQSRALIRTFKQMKDYIIENQGLIGQRDYLQLSLDVAEHSRDINAIKNSLRIIDNEVAEVVESLGNVVTKSELANVMHIFGYPEYRNEYILWDGQPFEADLAYSTIYGSAKKSVYVIDNYISIKTLALLKNTKEDNKIIIFSDNVGKRLHSTEYNDFCKQYPYFKIELKKSGKKYHDRYIIIDYGTEQEKIFHCGPSSKDGGNKIGSIVEIREREAYHTLVQELLDMPILELK